MADAMEKNQDLARFVFINGACKWGPIYALSCFTIGFVWDYATSKPMVPPEIMYEAYLWFIKGEAIGILLAWYGWKQKRKRDNPGCTKLP